jgi:hypothetical protein
MARYSLIRRTKVHKQSYLVVVVASQTDVCEKQEDQCNQKWTNIGPLLVVTVDGVVHLGSSAFESFSYMSPGATAKRLQKRLRIVAIQGFLQYIHVVQWHRHRYSTRQKTLQGAPGSRSKARKILLSH